MQFRINSIPKIPIKMHCIILNASSTSILSHAAFISDANKANNVSTDIIISTGVESKNDIIAFFHFGRRFDFEFDDEVIREALLSSLLRRRDVLLREVLWTCAVVVVGGF